MEGCLRANWQGDQSHGREHRYRVAQCGGVRLFRPAICFAGIAPGRRKKRILALAEHHFEGGGGEAYCKGCVQVRGRRCPDCPYVVSAPHTSDGAATWEVIRRINGQLRCAPIIVDGEQRSGGVYGLDFGSVIRLAEGMGAASPLFFDLLPDIEGIMVRSYHPETEA